MLCWKFCYLMKGVEMVKRNGKVLKFEIFLGQLENLRFGMGFKCLGNLEMMYMRFRHGF